MPTCAESRGWLLACPLPFGGSVPFLDSPETDITRELEGLE